jgi:hypothetical protein
MQGKTFFLERAVSRALDWLGRYPALGCASHDPQSISSGRQGIRQRIPVLSARQRGAKVSLS